jgi:hypothetical protein
MLRIGLSREGRYYIRAMHPETTDDHAFTALFASCDHQYARSETSVVTDRK